MLPYSPHELIRDHYPWHGPCIPVKSPDIVLRVKGKQLQSVAFAWSFALFCTDLGMIV